MLQPMLAVTKESEGSIKESKSSAQTITVTAGTTTFTFEELTDIAGVIVISNLYSAYRAWAYRIDDNYTYGGTYNNLLYVSSVNGNEVNVYAWANQSITVIAIGV